MNKDVINKRLEITHAPNEAHFTQSTRAPYQTYEYLADILAREVKGRRQDTDDGALGTIDLLLTSLFIGAHVLLEDYPGSGKTFLAKVLANSIDFNEGSPDHMSGYQRVQCMVDLLPTDITGTELKERDQWVLSYGPIFSHVLLVDEINRTTPRVQAAFLEAMAEKQITISRRTLLLEPVFFLIATQNPFDRAGTFELPYAQLDRFLFKRVLTPLKPEDLRAVISMNYDSSAERPAPVKMHELLSAMGRLNRPLVSREIEDDLLSLHKHFTRRVSTGDKADTTRVIAPECSLSPRTLRLFKRAVDFRVNLDEERTGSPKAYSAERHLTPLLIDLLRHRITLSSRTSGAAEVLLEIKRITQDVLEESLQRQRARST